MINCDQSEKPIFQDDCFHAGLHQHCKQTALRILPFSEAIFPGFNSLAHETLKKYPNHCGYLQ